MNDSVTKDIRVSKEEILPLKKCWPVGPHTVVILDDKIVRDLGINTDDTYVEEQITSDGILLRIKRIGG
jgi:hypothetical protein